MKVSGWMSEFKSVNNLLRYLKNRKIGSEASRKIFCCSLYMFCRHVSKTPDELVAMSKNEIENLMEDFGYKKKECGCSSRTINVLLGNLKTFFRVNGFRHDELDIELYYQPLRARARPEYVPTLEEALKMVECAKTLRDKAIISLMVFSGLRNSSARGIRYGDVREQLERGEDTLLIRVYPDMKKIVPFACKGNIEYFTFVPKKTTDILRLYLAQRLDKVGEIRDQDPLFSSEYNQLPREARSSKPLSIRLLEYIVKQVAKNANIKEWKAVTPHCLRKTFETLLRSRLNDGSRLDMQTQIYLMGHTLPGGLQPYFDARIEDLRKEYSKLVFDPSEEKLTKAIEVLKATSELLHSYDGFFASSGMKKVADIDLNEASKAIRDFVKEIQTDHVCIEPVMNSSSRSEREDQSGAVCNKDSMMKTPVESVSRQTNHDSQTRIKSSTRKSKFPARIDQSPFTKQTALDLFSDSYALREG